MGRIEVIHVLASLRLFVEAHWTPWQKTERLIPGLGFGSAASTGISMSNFTVVRIVGLDLL